MLGSVYAGYVEIIDYLGTSSYCEYFAEHAACRNPLDIPSIMRVNYQLSGPLDIAISSGGTVTQQTASVEASSR